MTGPPTADDRAGSPPAPVAVVHIPHASTAIPADTAAWSEATG